MPICRCLATLRHPPARRGHRCSGGPDIVDHDHRQPAQVNPGHGSDAPGDIGRSLTHRDRELRPPVASLQCPYQRNARHVPHASRDDTGMVDSPPHPPDISRRHRHQNGASPIHTRRVKRGAERSSQHPADVGSQLSPRGELDLLDHLTQQAGVLTQSDSAGPWQAPAPATGTTRLWPSDAAGRNFVGSHGRRASRAVGARRVGRPSGADGARCKGGRRETEPGRFDLPPSRLHRTENAGRLRGELRESGSPCGIHRRDRQRHRRHSP
jgi:hypothetical protein